MKTFAELTEKESSVFVDGVPTNRVARVAAVKLDRKQTKDRDKCWRDIEALSAFIGNAAERLKGGNESPESRAAIVEAASAEMDRLVARIDDPEALQRIYRRNGK